MLITAYSVLVVLFAHQNTICSVMTQTILISIGRKARRKLDDHDIELIRQLREAGLLCRVIADKFEVSVSFVEKVCRFERRHMVEINH